MILEKVSFDQQLLSKEYRKAKHVLHSHEAQQLDRWLKAKGLYPGVFQTNPSYQKAPVKV
ncbi:hypothetical protein [Catalinimonas niigatensis]|uniref:hypothetical protein n=1 Tax=Catalinimonas niigatensis TaxID=1397264 RepID=UPI0026664525|nr:hypothetical protein [Catalinimonas niigatensis]WPP48653.1 hypothetical protein PZB72_18445 [Catalinimonas niigatensis]